MESKRPYDFLLDIKNDKGRELYDKFSSAENLYCKEPYEDHSNKIRQIYELFMLKLAENHSGYNLVYTNEFKTVNYTRTWYQFNNTFDFDSINLEFDVDYKLINECCHYSESHDERTITQIRSQNISMLHDVYSLAKAYYSILTGLKRKFPEYIAPEPLKDEEKIKIIEKTHTIVVEKEISNVTSENDLKRLELKYNRTYNTMYNAYDYLKQEYNELYKKYLKFQHSYIYLEDKCNKLIDENKTLKLNKQKPSSENDYKTIILAVRDLMKSLGCFATPNTIFKYLKGIHSRQSDCFNLSSKKYWGMYADDIKFTDKVVSDNLPIPYF